jgi:hypothetical protein
MKVNLKIAAAILFFAVLSVPLTQAQQEGDEKPSDAKPQVAQPIPPAPVPPQIAAGKKVFISNAGLDNTSLSAFKRAGEPDGPYNRFYAAMKTWGHYELVAGPADADLVFEIGFTSQLSGGGDRSPLEAQFQLSILDSKTHFVLWTLAAPVQGAFRKGTFEKNVADGMTNLMDDLKRIIVQPAAAVK